MNKYNDGKIYKIIVNIENCDECYFGSTIQKLCQRFANHKSTFKRYKEDKDKTYRSSFYLFEKYGVDNCKIILVENYPCENREELNQREQYYIDTFLNCNKINSFMTEEQTKESNKQSQKKYRENNKEKIIEYKKEYNKEYYEQNKEQKKEKSKQYYKNNKEKIKEQKKQYYENNKEKILEKK